MTLFEWLAKEPFTLSMSSGFFGFFAHCGMLSALEENNLLPNKLTGSSAGALIAGSWGAGLNTGELEQELMAIKKEDFWDPAFGLGFLRGEKYRQRLNKILPTNALENCRRPVAISVYNASKRSTEIFTSGSIVDAIYASGAVPLLFHPLHRNNDLYWDGGIKDRHGLASVKLGEERVFYHHISSKSPWRRANSPALKVPEKRQLVGLSIQGLPRSGPNKLQVGKAAFTQAKTATLRALEMKLQNDPDQTGDQIYLNAENR